MSHLFLSTMKLEYVSTFHARKVIQAKHKFANIRQEKCYDKNNVINKTELYHK